MEANKMNPDQTAPLIRLLPMIWVHMATREQKQRRGADDNSCDESANLVMWVNLISEHSMVHCIYQWVRG